MKREEKNRKSLKEILQAAMAEFGTCDYGEVTLNHICERHHISKGLFYHYFSGKDELFLLCVKQAFTSLESELEQKVYISGNLDENINRYFQVRNAFFERNPLEKQVFSSATFQCPPHLQEQVAQLRLPLQSWNHRYFQQVFSQLELRPGISFEEAAEYFSRFEEIFGYLLRSSRKDGASLPEMEQATRRLLDRMLYGIARQPKESGDF